MILLQLAIVGPPLALAALFLSEFRLAHGRVLDTGICSWNRSGVLFASVLSICPVPIDDVSTSHSGDFFPWSYAPYCLNGTEIPSFSSRFCVFTSTQFRGNCGISFITTPELAASVVSALDDSCVPPRIRDHPSGPLYTGDGRSKAYDIRDLRGRGKGAVARRQILRGEVIMALFPAIIIRADFPQALNMQQRRRILKRSLNQLPTDQQAVVLSLAHSTGGELIEDILHTNAYVIELNDVPHVALFNEGSVRFHQRGWV
jgi:hypothetical protein